MHGWTTGPLMIFFAVALPLLNPFAPGPSAQVVPLLVSWLGCAALLAVFRPAWVRPVAWGWLAAALLSSVIGLCQYFGIAEFFAPWMNAGSAGEAFANLRQRNQLATLTNMGVAALLWWFGSRWQRDAGSKGRPELIAAYLGLAILVAGNAASASRIGALQLLGLVFLTGIWKTPFRARLLATAVAGLLWYVAAAAVLPFLLEFFWDIPGQNVFARMANEQGCASRRVLWTNVLQLIAQKPWTGWGWGELDYAHYATLYPGERFCDILDNAHNLPLHLAVELGIPLAVLLCSATAWLAIAAAPWRASKLDHRLAWMVLAVIMLHSMVEYPLWYGPFQMAAGLCIWLLWPMARGANDERLAGDTRFMALRRGTALLLTGAIALAGWDYSRVSEIYRPPEERSSGYRDDTLAKLSGSWLFRNQVQFAALSLTALTPANAAPMAALANELLHFSPERRVIEVLIESSMLMGREDQALWHMARYRAAFPEDFAAWNSTYRGALPPSR